jgi:hypothetical protein
VAKSREDLLPITRNDHDQAANTLATLGEFILFPTQVLRHSWPLMLLI